MRLEGKVAVITGAGNGIGAETARQFVKNGAKVIVADIADEAGSGLAEKVGDHAHYVHCDVTNEDHVAAAIASATEHFGRLDVMFNNAGIIGGKGPIATTPVDIWHRTIDVVLTGVFYGVKHAAAALVAQGSGGSIISTSSTAGLRGGLAPHVYTAAKHGVIGLTKSVANELAPHAIRVNAISPGNTVTAMTEAVGSGEEKIAARSPLGYAGFPIDIAHGAVYLASEESRYMSGHTLVVDAGQTTAGMDLNRIHTGRNAMLADPGEPT